MNMFNLKGMNKTMEQQKSENKKIQPDLVKDIKTSHDARLAIFERITAVLNRCYIEIFQESSMRDVWDVSSVVPYVDQNYNISINSLQFTCLLGDQPFSYSIAISIGEVRIGVIVPSDLSLDVEKILMMTEPYPFGTTDPLKLVRSLPSKGFLLDFIFRTRFADLSVTKAALESRVKGSIEIDTLADAVARELIHINNCLMNAFAHQGLLITADKIYDPREFEMITLYSKEQPSAILETYRIERSQLYIRGRHVFGLLLPNRLISETDIQQRIEKANEEFMTNSTLVEQLGT